MGLFLGLGFVFWGWHGLFLGFAVLLVLGFYCFGQLTEGDPVEQVFLLFFQLLLDDLLTRILRQMETHSFPILKLLKLNSQLPLKAQTDSSSSHTTSTHAS